MTTFKEALDVASATWHGSLKDPTNAAMKFFGETGELTDYIAKCEFKPNFWGDKERIVSEAGDCWYYWRMLVTIHKSNPLRSYGTLENFIEEVLSIRKESSLQALSYMAVYSAGVFFSSCSYDKTYKIDFDHAMEQYLIKFILFLEDNGISFEEMHTYNVNKLSGVDNHGWRPK